MRLFLYHLVLTKYADLFSVSLFIQPLLDKCVRRKKRGNYLKWKRTDNIQALRTFFNIERAQIFQKGATSRPFEAT